MTTSVATQSQVQLPAHILAAMEEGGMGSNIATRSVGVDQLTFRGKVWRAMVQGEEIIQSNADGDPVSTIKVVIIAGAASRSRAYYEGQFKEGENRAPTCFSADGKTPDGDVEYPQGDTCANCPMAAKGSRVSQDGRVGVACSSFKNLVVVPAYDLNFPLLRLRLPQTSIWDKETVEKGWYAFDNYLEALRVRGMPHTGVLVTKIKFDSSKAYPKLLFSMDVDHDPKYKGFLNAEEAGIVASRNKEDMSALLGASAMVGGARVTAIAAPKAKPAAPAVEAKAPVSKPKEPEVATSTGEGLDSLLNDWDDA